ncbi:MULTISPECIES: 3-hydroxyacyl-ACP dehydratase FabZ [Bacillota]|jgi:3-hydroxyacyl-[acyl-carrier-protein] dehydratase|uniref:3-hydroxyacyl-[acyl-carrier-protein] dehydratase FabZ n=2 Tax=Amedibacillus TaxID=2749846 RepID=A0A7G9GK72_9FIRM|nr:MULTISPECIES: 3-hydroxyacyl-ACP dehydratase FabZ [Bacillota]QNM11204.1 3-hydroxyacyl-ACP dehydratase FabZ [[Eubacterium] hominis]MCH4284744.1 3-hydroxyacyl-ACP dehydratase FabZ [Amedibacillus hominis]RGB52581.1 3-hydroxyacyl-[acyl-carrier-protein] dehydratase FabZ [Absiella sp. AM22-9]RGB57054.1 3-hydroxyacyl-[acyl-carrier-protein] dehydratase FabZ [Absiella sp. AM10-20]RGB68097.1 3-hydroxyacyl-[acyl-carrier-protein] dehydratase FabZ [Absiella sp. AM09-45]
MLYNSNEIQEIIPHRYPFLLVDRIESIEGNKVVGTKCISANEMQFLGHFPEKHIMPGVLQLEALAQTVAVMLLSKEENKGKIGLFAGIDKARFKRQVIPGDVLRLEAEVIRERMGIAWVKAVASVDGEVAVTAEMMFAVSDK